VDEADGEVTPRFQIIILSCWLPSSPENMKVAFDTLIDQVIEMADGVLDWGTMSFRTERAIHPDTGQEMHLFTIGVKEIR
jgi:hypothetical protein